MNNNIQVLKMLWRVRIVILIILLCSNPIFAAGVLDTTFGVGGKVNFRIAQTSDYPTGAVLQPDGKIVIIGSSVPSGQSNGLRDFAIARLNPDGTLDNTFGSVGTITTAFGFQQEDIPGSVFIQPDGKIVVGGRSETVFALARYNPNGTLDKTFGVGGKVTTDFPESLTEGIGVLLPQADGKFIAIGGLVFGSSSPDGQGQIGLVRYNTDGSLDTSFGTGGKFKIFFGNIITSLSGAVMQPDGKFLISGSYSFRRPNCVPTKFDSCIDGQNFLMRFDQNLRIDRKFGRRYGQELSRDSFTGLYLQADGHILIGGFPLVRRYSPNGRRETTFDYALPNMPGGGLQNGPSKLTQRPDGKIVGCRITGSNGYDDVGVVLFSADGHVIGYEQRDFFGGNDACGKILIQPDGKTLVVGNVQVEQQGSYSFAVIRYLDFTL